MSRDCDLDRDVRLALHVNNFVAGLRFFPTFGCEVLAVVFEVFNVQVFHSGANISESPRDAPIVANDHVWVTGQRDSNCVESAGFQMSFIPEVRHLVSQMHIV